MFMCIIYVCIYNTHHSYYITHNIIALSLEDFSRLRALTELKVVSYDRVVDNTLLRHVFSEVLFLARA